MKTVERATAFLLALCLLLSLAEALLVEKSSYGKNRGWKAAEDVDILILGNSHADGGFRAEDMSAGLCTGGGDICVFNYGISSIRIEQMYFFAREALKTHVPKLVILETFTFCPLADEDREITNRRAFDALPLNLNKIEAIRYCVPEGRASFYLPLMKYHTRWKELSAGDLRLLYDKDIWNVTGGNGSVSENTWEDPGDGWFQQEPPEETREISPAERECLERLLVLLEEKGVSLLLVSVPFKTQKGLDSIEQIKINNYLRENYVDGDMVRLLDMNRMWRELDFDYADLANEGHVNAMGADKVTACLLEYLKKTYDIAALAA